MRAILDFIGTFRAAGHRGIRLRELWDFYTPRQEWLEQLRRGAGCLYRPRMHREPGNIC